MHTPLPPPPSLFLRRSSLSFFLLSSSAASSASLSARRASRSFLLCSLRLAASSYDEIQNVHNFRQSQKIPAKSFQNTVTSDMCY